MCVGGGDDSSFCPPLVSCVEILLDARQWTGVTGVLR